MGGGGLRTFNKSTGPAPARTATPPLPETANYYDVGIEQKFTRELTVGIDTFYKQSANLIDAGQFGAPIILTPFNYRNGQQYGAELAINFSSGPLSLYVNAATQRGRGKDTITSQFNFD